MLKTRQNVRWLMALGVLCAACESSSSDRSPTLLPDAAVPQGGADAGAGGAPHGGAAPGASGAGDPTPPADWCQNDDTVLGQAARALGAGEWVELPANASLDALELHYHLTAWADTGVWNPLARRVQWVGSPGSCCADPATYRLLAYDVASDTWQVHETPWLDDAGHAYDGNAFDPATGIHYFARGGADIRGWDGASWGEPLPEAPFYAAVAVGLTWVREANGGAGGLLHVGVGNDVGLFDGTNWTTPDLGTVDWGNYHMFAEYNPVRHVVWLGAGNEGEQQHVRLTATLEAAQLQDAPVSLNATGVSQKTYDPVSGKFIVLSEVDEIVTWWEYDIVSDTWTDLTTTMAAALPASWSPDGFRFMVPIDDCGVILLFRHQDASRHAYLYRHSSP